MTQLDALLYELFTYLRRPIGLGTGDYLLMIETLRAGYGMEHLEGLQSVCRLLWAKSREDQQLFDEAYDRLVAPFLVPVIAPAPHTPDPLPEISSPLENSATPANLPQEAGGPPVEPVHDLDYVALRQGLAPLLPMAEEHTPAVATGVYQFSPQLPMSRREMSSIWRHLRRMRRDGPALDLDVEATLDKLCRDGYLIHPVLQPRRRNQARLLILVDRLGSMIPFTPWVDALVESIRKGGLLGRVVVLYFNNVPRAALYGRPALVDRKPLAPVLAEVAAGNAVLIVSDAGAARGFYRSQRVDETRTFLDQLKQHTTRIVWMNPLRPARWAYTSAEDIAMLVPMAPFDRQGMVDAVDILRGRSLPFGILRYDFAER